MHIGEPRNHYLWFSVLLWPSSFYTKVCLSWQLATFPRLCEETERIVANHIREREGKTKDQVRPGLPLKVGASSLACLELRGKPQRVRGPTPEMEHVPSRWHGPEFYLVSSCPFFLFEGLKPSGPNCPPHLCSRDGHVVMANTGFMGVPQVCVLQRYLFFEFRGDITLGNQFSLLLTKVWGKWSPGWQGLPSC